MIFRKDFIVFILFTAFILNACISYTEKNPLIEAAAKGNLPHVEQLIQQGADVNARNTMDLDALSYAIMNEHPDIVLYLLNHGAKVTSTHQTGTTVLIIAATVGDTRIIKLLHERGASINQANHNGITPLMAAAGSGNKDAILLLLSYGADPCSRDKQGRNTRQIANQWLGYHEVEEFIHQDNRLASINCLKEKNE